jgi:hypothetical protein
MVPASIFAGAERFHGGGVVGGLPLFPGERPIIAQVGERITPAGQAASPAPIVQIINQTGGRVETRQTTGPRGEPVQQVIIREVEDAIASGRMDRGMRSRYGVSPAVGMR